MLPTTLSVLVINGCLLITLEYLELLLQGLWGTTKETAIEKGVSFVQNAVSQVRRAPVISTFLMLESGLMRIKIPKKQPMKCMVSW